MITLAQTDSAGASGGAALLIVLLVLLGAAAYFVPTIVASLRKVPNLGSVIVVNLLLGWTFVGWVVAMAMACRSQLPPAQINYISPYPPPPPDPASPMGSTPPSA